MKKIKKSSNELEVNEESSKKSKQYTFIEVEDFNRLVSELGLENEVGIKI